VFLDAARGRYLRASQPDLVRRARRRWSHAPHAALESQCALTHTPLSRQALSASANAAAAAALQSAQPQAGVDADASAQARGGSPERTAANAMLPRPFLITTLAQVNALLAPTVFDRPAALLSVQLAGVPSEASVAGASFDFPASSRPIAGGSAAVAAALAPLLGAPLPRTCEQPCDAACLSTALGGAPLPAALPLDDPSVVQLIAELGCFLAGARSAAAAPETRLVSARLSAYAAVLKAHAAGSEVERAAGQLVASTLSAALAALAAPRDGAAAAHVTLLASEGGEAGGARRALLQVPAQRSLDAWYAKVAAFGVGILLLVATLGTIVCLCTLPTGTDTLLYARTKAD
jgi:hypothetical protein